jgi:S1-C subfamily serine protease
MNYPMLKRWHAPVAVLAAGAAVLLAVGLSLRAADEKEKRGLEVDKRVLEAEKKRVEAIEKVQAAVVAVMTGGGSGVLISEDGYALTNFHVTDAARGPFMKCGLPDGKIYDAVLVGLDKVGDVALIKLLPKKAGDKFPYAKLGDSDKLQAGDWSLAMGNPFLLATDFTPTVTFGLISGVHRYQYPEGTLLEYTDCIQIDTSINPGNSGGPLFNMDGELVGINGRGSFEKRGRVNSGVGYAISINQIKNFMGHLRAGLDSDHASLGAIIASGSEEGPIDKMIVQRIIPCDAERRGLDVGDQLVSFSGRPISSVNAFKNVLGIYPRGWRVPLIYRRENEKLNEKREILVRLMGVTRQELPGNDDPDKPKPPPMPKPQPLVPNSPAAKFYEEKPGYANFFFNKQERERLVTAFQKQAGDFTKAGGDWTIKATGTFGPGGPKKGEKFTAEFVIKDKGAADGKSDLVKATVADVNYSLEPLAVDLKEDVVGDPQGSGGLLLALYHYRQVVALNGKGMKDFSHGGSEPFYLPAPGNEKPDYAKLRVDSEVLRTEYAGVPGKWYFSGKDQSLLGFEISPDRERDPCEVYLSDYQKDSDGRMTPKRIEVRYGDKVYAVMDVTSFKVEPAK